jgi:hypothetical protein
MTDEQPLAGLKALRELTQQPKAWLEQPRDAYGTLEMPDPGARRWMESRVTGALYSVATLDEAKGLYKGSAGRPRQGLYVPHGRVARSRGGGCEVAGGFGGAVGDASDEP